MNCNILFGRSKPKVHTTPTTLSSNPTGVGGLPTVGGGGVIPGINTSAAQSVLNGVLSSNLYKSQASMEAARSNKNRFEENPLAGSPLNGTPLMKSISDARSPLFHAAATAQAQANATGATYPDWLHHRTAQYNAQYNPLAGINMLPGMVPFPGSHNLPAWATNPEAAKAHLESAQKLASGGASQTGTGLPAQLRDSGISQALGYNLGNHFGSKMGDLINGGAFGNGQAAASEQAAAAMKINFEKTHNMMQSILYSKGGHGLGSPNTRSPDSKLVNVDHDRISIQ